MAVSCGKPTEVTIRQPLWSGRLLNHLKLTNEPQSQGKVLSLRKVAGNFEYRDMGTAKTKGCTVV